MNEIEKQLEEIAMQESWIIKERGGLDTRNNDTEDFPEIPVWAIRKMLRRAYELGKNE